MYRVINLPLPSQLYRLSERQTRKSRDSSGPQVERWLATAFLHKPDPIATGVLYVHLLVAPILGAKRSLAISWSAFERSFHCV